MEITSLAEVNNEFNSVSEKSVSLERAIEIFDLLADRRDIAFGYPSDGCYARAHIMCRSLEGIGLVPKKAWAFEGIDALEVKTPEGKRIQWSWHVTAAISVQMPDQSIQDMVLDPGLFDGPVSLEEWGNIMKASPEVLQITPFGVPPKGYSGDYGPYEATSTGSDARSKRTMEDYLPRQEKTPRIVFPSRSRQQLRQNQQNIPVQGATWVSGEELPLLTKIISKGREWIT